MELGTASNPKALQISATLPSCQLLTDTAFRNSRLQPSHHSAGLQCIFTIPSQNVFLIIAYGNLPRA